MASSPAHGRSQSHAVIELTSKALLFIQGTCPLWPTIATGIVDENSLSRKSADNFGKLGMSSGSQPKNLAQGRGEASGLSSAWPTP